MARVLVIEDDLQMLENYRRLLKRMGHECLPESESASAVEKLPVLQPDIVLTDLRMPVRDGFDVITEVNRLCPDVPVVLITAYADIPTAVEAVRRGAHDVLPKPFTAEQLELVIERALRQKALKEENRILKEQLGWQSQEMVTCSPVMQDILKMIDRLSSSEANVLITGESGTGKELVARIIHQRSPRSEGPFVPVDCGAIPDNLLESELFGYEKGAFTGATQDRQGLLEAASGGTVFLDEVAELPLGMQVKLLRVLQDRKVRRLGSNRFIPLNIRVVSATNRPIQDLIKEGRFREDLFYRLNVINLHLPPLRERKEDIPLLARYFMKRYSLLYNRPVEEITREALQILRDYHWPGNVRQLQNVIERAVLLCEDRQLSPSDLPEEIINERSTGEITDFRRAREEFERGYLRKLLASTGGNVSKAAELAGIHRRTIHRMIKKYRIG